MKENIKTSRSRLQTSGMTSLRDNSHKAFTLIELLVVVLIIGILSAIALPQYQKVVIKSKAVALLPRLKAIHSAQKIYHMENDRYIGDIRNLPGHDLALSDEQKYNGGLWHIKTLDGFWVSASLFWIAVIGTDQIEWRISNTDDLYCCARKANKAAMDICKSYGSNAATDTVCGAGEFWCRCGIIQL